MRVLLLTHRLPYAPNRGDRVRAYHLLRHLAKWADVDLLSLVHDDDEASHAADLEGTAATVTVIPVSKARGLYRGGLALPTTQPLTHAMLDGPGLNSALRRIVHLHPPDVVLAYCSGMARFALEPPLADIPLVLDMVDVDSAKWAALSATASIPRSWIYAREARWLARFEQRAARHASVTLVVAERERDALRLLAPDARVEVVPNGVDSDSLRPPDPPAGLPIVVFCGVMDYEPNVEAALWLVREVWPVVRRQRPDARVQIVGARPTASVRALANDAMGVEVSGEVPDVRPYLWGAAVSAAPLQTARGVQNKVLEAVAAGLPVVVTPVVMQGLPPEVRSACLAAGNAPEFAAAIVTLLDEPATARRARVLRSNLAPLSWSRRFEPLREMLDAAAKGATSGPESSRPAAL